MEDHDDQDRESMPPPDDAIVRAEDLFHDRQEIWIDLNGERYRLRITRRGKLILQK